MGSGSYHQFYVVGHYCEIDIRTRRIPVKYHLYIEGRDVETGVTREENVSTGAEILTFIMMFCLGFLFSLLGLLCFWCVSFFISPSYVVSNLFFLLSLQHLVCSGCKEQSHQHRLYTSQCFGQRTRTGDYSTQPACIVQYLTTGSASLFLSFLCDNSFSRFL